MAIPNDTIKKLLTDAGIIDETTWKQVERESKRMSLSPERILISRGVLTEKYLNELVSKFLNIPAVNLEEMPPTLEILQVLPESIARSRNAVVFGIDKDKNIYRVAMKDPTDVEATSFLREYLKGEVESYLATEAGLRTAYRVYKKKQSEEFEKEIDTRINELATAIKGTNANILESVPLVKLFDTILDYAGTTNSSDIYFQPEETALLIRFRIDGVVQDVIKIDRALNDGIVARAKVLSGLRIDEHMKPQDGRFRFKVGDQEDIDIRTAVIPTFFGEKITMRLLSGASNLLTLEELGMSQEAADKVRAEAKRPYGMILSTGPTGSGKTTTIYALINILNRPEVHITTIEDPVEYIIPHVSQTQVNNQAGITFASGLRSLLRHSPDVIVLGEIRDQETADVATHSALTGHLLISTLHTNDAPTAAPRLTDLNVAPFLVAATVNAVVAQRLIRKICRQCIGSLEPQPYLIEVLQTELKKQESTTPIPKVFFRGSGCSACGFTGYTGRTGIFEVYLLDEKTKALISGGKFTLADLKDDAKRQGMKTMLEDGLEKVEQGITTAEEVLRVIRE